MELTINPKTNEFTIKGKLKNAKDCKVSEKGNLTLFSSGGFSAFAVDSTVYKVGLNIITKA